MSEYFPMAELDCGESDVIHLPERREYVYALGLDRAEDFAREVGSRLALESHAEDGDGNCHYVTTLYFDSTSHDIARSCELSENNVKLRAREYGEGSGELEISPEPVLWFELKLREGDTTRKLRFAVPNAEVAAFLREGVITERTLELQRARLGADAEAMLDQVVRLCARADGPLRPDCLAHYRRRAWQDPEGLTRVTLDTELAFYRAPPRLFRNYTNLLTATHEPPVVRADHGVVELKLRRECPTWLRQALQRAGLEFGKHEGSPYSKFLAASSAVAATSSEHTR